MTARAKMAFDKVVGRLQKGTIGGGLAVPVLVRFNDVKRL